MRDEIFILADKCVNDEISFEEFEKEWDKVMGK